MRQIQRLEVDGESGGQSAQREFDGADANGIGTFEREVLAEVGWEVRRVCE